MERSSLGQSCTRLEAAEVNAMALTPKQTLFVAKYLANGLNATKAAISAGYAKKNADTQGARLLVNVKVAEAIAAKQGPRLEKLEITAERVLRELALLGFSNMLDYMTVNEDGFADINLKALTRDQAAAIQEISVDMTGGSGDGKRELVPRMKFKLANKRDSLELLGKNLKLFTDKVEFSGSVGLAEAIAEARKRAAE